MNVTRLSTAATVLLLVLLLSTLVPVSPVHASAELEQAISVLDRLDDLVVRANYAEASLEAVINSIDQQIEIPIRVDWEALRRIGIRASDEIQMDLGSTTAATVLSALMTSLSDEFERPVYEINASHVVITIPELAASMRLTAAYDVRDLLTDGHTFKELSKSLVTPDAEPAATGPEDAGTPDEPAREDDDYDEGLDLDDLEVIPRSPAVDLLYMIMEHVDPDAWVEYGGTAGKISERDGALIVTAVPSTHRKLRETLRALRQANPQGVLLEGMILDIDAAELTRLRRRHDPGTVALARSIQRSGTIQWRAEAVVGFGSTYSSKSTSGKTSVEVNITPSFDAEPGILTLGVSAISQRETGHSAVETTIRIASTRGAAVIELPSAAAASKRQMLILLPTRQ